MTRNNIVSIDLRKLSNHKIWDLGKIIDLDSEVKARGFSDIFQLAREPATYFGIYPTKDEYLSTFEKPQDNRTDGGC